MLLPRRTVLAATLLAPWLASGRAAATEPLIEVIPLGKPDEADVGAVVGAVRAFFALNVKVSAPIALPKEAYYVPRKRFRADRLLEHLLRKAKSEARVALGLAAVDISTTKGDVYDWGVLGLATLDGRSAVLSSFRCQRKARDRAHARERFAKTAVHELGHSFGLDHCPTTGCLMHDGEGSVLTTDGETDFCADTRSRLTAAGVLRIGARSPFVR